MTAGNASGQNDGAAVCIVTHAERAAELGLEPMARLVGWAVAGVAPRTMGIGPVPATAKALARAGLSLEQMDLIELNEAFAAQALAVLREWDLPDGLERVNVNGSGISLGHPIGATGGRILATLLRELRRRGARYGLETMCIGGGQGLAAIFENVQAGVSPAGRPGEEHAARGDRGAGADRAPRRVRAASARRRSGSPTGCARAGCAGRDRGGAVPRRLRAGDQQRWPSASAARRRWRPWSAAGAASWPARPPPPWPGDRR